MSHEVNPPRMKNRKPLAKPRLPTTADDGDDHDRGGATATPSLPPMQSSQRRRIDRLVARSVRRRASRLADRPVQPILCTIIAQDRLEVVGSRLDKRLDRLQYLDR